MSRDLTQEAEFRGSRVRRNIEYPKRNFEVRREGQNKSDKTDAHRLAMMYHHGFFPEVYIPEKLVRQKRSLIYYRQKIVSRMTQVKNSIRALMTTVAIDLPAGKNCWAKKYRKQLRQLALPFGQHR